MIIDVILLGLILIAVWFDVKERRIPNRVILAGLIAAMLNHLLRGDYMGFLLSIKGLALGIGLLIVPYLLGGLGAGDVKLLGMIGALKGGPFVINTFLWMALIGGIIAVIILMHRQLLKETVLRLVRGLFLSWLGAGKFFDSVNQKEISVYYPYGVAIGLGVVATYVKGWW
ncbi:MAG: A24 family peptidase [Syntrophomonadaceae bacterium]